MIPQYRRHDLVLGLDGGGTSTIALLASFDDGTVLGRGTAGPSNIQAVGVEAGLKALDESIDRAFASAGLPRAEVRRIALGLAGIDREEGLDIIRGWAARLHIAESVRVANDATLLLAAGTPEGWGLAVIAGTGSIAFVQTPDGKPGRCGGWGYLLGDEGSAYMIALNALRAACRSFDGVLPPSILVEQLVAKMALKEAPDFIPAVYRGGWDRTAIAGLCPGVLEAADGGDALAVEVVEREARELARTAARAVVANGLPSSLPVALSGGVLIHGANYRTKFLAALCEFGLAPNPVRLVDDPVVGAVVLARRG